MISLILAALLAAPLAAENVRLTVFHTNDVHGWVMARPSKERPERSIGGAAALASVVRSHRRTGAPTLLLDAGDWFQGTPEGTITRGKLMAEVFNALPYDAVVVGNHDYDFAEGTLRELVTQIRPPVLSANIFSKGTGARVGYVRPWILKEVAGVKVGIFGLTTSNMRNLVFARNIVGLEFRDEVQVARQAVAELKAQGATVIIAVTHVGVDKADPSEKDIAARVSGIDLVVGGHSHTYLREALRDPANGTLIVQAGQYLTHVGRATLEIDPASRRVVSSSAVLVGLWTDETGEDPELKAISDRYEREVGMSLEIVVGTAAEGLHRDRHAESPMGDWMTDCARKWTKTQVAFQNAGGIRAELPAGPVTLRQLFSVMPFDNYIVTLNMTGELLRQTLERGLSGEVGMLQVSGLRLRYDSVAPVGKRLRKVWVGGRRLDLDEVYSVTALDFMVLGGDGYTPFGRAADKAFTETLMRDVLGWCAKEYSPIRAAPPDRMIKE